MNNPMITSKSNPTAEREILKPAPSGIHLVCRNHRPAAGVHQTKSAQGNPVKTGRAQGKSAQGHPAQGKAAQGTPAHGIALVGRSKADGLQPAAQTDTVPVGRSAESVRIKLAACFGAMLGAPLVWCLHSLVLSLQTR